MRLEERGLEALDVALLHLAAKEAQELLEDLDRTFFPAAHRKAKANEQSEVRHVTPRFRQSQ